MNPGKDKDRPLKEPSNKVIRKALEKKKKGAPKDDEPSTAVNTFRNR
jgi:hypothetical protein